MAFKNQEEYERAKQTWRSNRMRDRSPAGYERFKRNEGDFLAEQKAKEAAKNNAAQQEQKKPENTPRDTGNYGDITNAQAEDRAAGQAAATDFANQGGGNVGGIDPAIQSQLDALTLANTNLSNKLGERETYWSNTLTTIQNNNAAAMTRMEDLMLQQANAAAAQQTLLTSQLQSTQNALQEQQRMSTNLANAYVPQAEQSAQSASYGDQRTTTRKKESNSLNDLSIVSGVGSSNSLSGLTLA